MSDTQPSPNDNFAKEAFSRKGGKSTKKVELSRRKLLKTSTQVGAIALATGGGIAVGSKLATTSHSVHAAGPNAFTLPISMDTNEGFKMFLHALSDAKVRSGMQQSADQIPPQAQQLLSMMDDQTFIQLGMAATDAFGGFLHGQVTKEQLQTQAMQLHSHVTANYPGGFQALQTFASTMLPQFNNKMNVLQAQVDRVMQGDYAGSETNPELADFAFLSPQSQAQYIQQANPQVEHSVSPVVAANLGAVANAGAVVNALVYANVAVATLGLVAGAVFVCIAVAICPAVSTDVTVAGAGAL